MIGRRLGKDGFIEITDRLGAGGMGAVFRARDHKRGRDLAVKFLEGDLASDPEVVHRFMKEGRRFAGLTHPNVARVYGLGKEAGRLYVVAELIDGLDLRRKVREDGQLSTMEALRVAREIADGVGVAHEKGIVHRDLKPENVMIRHADESVAVLDFGIAKDLHGRTMLTAPGAWIGTPGYAAPEQVRGEVIDQRADIFALGVMFYEMLTGQLAFDGDRTMDVVKATLHRKPTSPAKLNEEVSNPVEKLIDRMLRKKPQKRIESMQLVSEHIRSIEERLESTPGAKAGMADRLRRLFGGE